MIASTSTAVRIEFDEFVEISSEIIMLLVHCEPTATQSRAKKIIIEKLPNVTEIVLSNLVENTQYKTTIYAITDEYLKEKGFHRGSQLPKVLPVSIWLTKVELTFQTDGCEPARDIVITSATCNNIDLKWTRPNAYGATRHTHYQLRCQSDVGDEYQQRVDPHLTSATIRGKLSMGKYSISLDTYFSIRVNLDENDDDTVREEIHLTTTSEAIVRYTLPVFCEQPVVFLAGYSTDTIDLFWQKPKMFDRIDHPERVHEKVFIHRDLIQYMININNNQACKVHASKTECSLTKCHTGAKHQIQLIAKTVVNKECMNMMASQRLSEWSSSSCVCVCVYVCVIDSLGNRIHGCGEYCRRNFVVHVECNLSEKGRSVSSEDSTN
jgi:hypothetical protein